MFDLKRALEDSRERVIALRRELHRNPELSLEEFQTARRIEEELDRLGIPHRRVDKTGVLAVLRGTGAGTGAVALRADTDALPIQEANQVDYRSQTPGVMHACGHDAHTACLLGAAAILAEHRDAFGGEVRLIFQHAEEIGHGAKPLVADGIMKGVDRVLGVHTAPDLPAGTVGLKPGLNNASVDHFTVTVQGKAAHVGTPQLGTDALYIASQIVVSLQALVARRTSPVEPVVVGVGRMTAGTVYNAVAAEAMLEGTTRTVSHDSRERIRELVTQTAQGVARLSGGSACVEWEDFAAPLFNDPEVCKEAAAVMDLLWGPGKVCTGRPLSLSGDDFAEYAREAPGAYAYLGTGNPALPGTLNPAHNGNFDIDENTLILGTGLYAGYVLSRLAEDWPGGPVR